jgi:hypothetical protein
MCRSTRRTADRGGGLVSIDLVSIDLVRINLVSIDLVRINPDTGE